MSTIMHQLDPTANQTWQSNNINSPQGYSYEETADVNAFSSSGLKTIAAVHLDRVHSLITVTSTDVTQASGAGYRIGQTGALALKYIQAADGGGTTGTSKTVTYASCVLVGNSIEVSTDSISTLVLSFLAYNSAGNDPVAYS